MSTFDEYIIQGNTRTTAVFTIQYLRSLGYDLDNSAFEQHSWYFRNILLGEQNELKNRYLYVDWKTENAPIQSITSETPKSHFDTLELNLDEKMILNAIASDPYIKQPQMAELIRKSIATVKRITVNLQQKGLLVRESGKRNGRWLLTNNSLTRCTSVRL